MKSKKLMCCRIEFGDKVVERFVGSAQAAVGFIELVDDDTKVTFFLKEVLEAKKS